MSRLLPLILLFLGTAQAHAQNPLACDSRGWFRPDESTGEVWIDRPAPEAKLPNSPNLVAQAVLKHEGWDQTFQKLCRALAPDLDFRPLNYFTSGKWTMTAERGSWDRWIALAENICAGRPVASMKKTRISSNEPVAMDDAERFAVMQYSGGYDYFACCKGSVPWIKSSLLEGKRHIAELSDLHASCQEVIKDFNQKKRELSAKNRKADLGTVEVRWEGPEPKTPPKTEEVAETEKEPVQKPTVPAKEPTKTNDQSKLPDNSLPPKKGTGIGCDMQTTPDCESPKTDAKPAPTPPEYLKKTESADANSVSLEDMWVPVSGLGQGDGGTGIGGNGGFQFNTKNSVQCTDSGNRQFDKVDRRFLACAICQTPFNDWNNSKMTDQSSNVGQNFAIWMNPAQACVYSFAFPDGFAAAGRAGLCDAIQPKSTAPAARVAEIQQITSDITLRCTEHLGVGPK